MAAITQKNVTEKTSGNADDKVQSHWIRGFGSKGKPREHHLHFSNFQSLHWLSLLLLLLAMTVSAIGLFDNGPGTANRFINAYGDKVILYGKGLYQNDSFFRAPIFRGSDFTILFLAAPLLLAAIFLDLKKATVQSKMMLASAINVIGYYASNVAFGVTYNKLHLVYILLFSTSFFSLLLALVRINKNDVEKSISRPLPRRSMTAFLAVTGSALCLAWLPDIITAFLNDRPPLLIEHYTTEVTYVLDMGIITPCCFLCLYLLKKNNGWGYIVLDLLLTLCVVMGVMLPVQTAFQAMAGVDVPLPALLTKMATFCLLALFAFYFKQRLTESMTVTFSGGDETGKPDDFN